VFRNYFKITLRNIGKNKAYSFINIFGLAVGMASFIIILLYLNYELSYDKWDSSLKRVAKVSLVENGDIRQTTQAPLASLLLEKYPNAEAATCMQSAGDFEVLLAAGDKKIYQEGMVMADSSFLKVFPYHLIQGNAATALNAPNAVILSEELSHKLFGNENPVGKTIKMYNAVDALVTGIFKNVNAPSHLNTQLIARDIHEKQNKFWENYSYQTYIKTKLSVSDEQLEDAINRIYYNERLKKNSQSFEAYKSGSYQTYLYVDKVQNIHNFPKHGSSNFTIVSVLLILAVLLLLAGAINFSNLSIAQSIGRAKEVGIRKVLGSARKQLVFQFMGETALQCLVSLFVALFIVFFALPYVNESFNLQLHFNGDNALSISLQIIACLLVVALLSGLYPSFFLSRFNTTKVLKGDYSRGKGGMLFRNSLIVLQFVFSVFFMVGAIVIKTQMKYMQERDKGFSGAQVMRLQTPQKTREQGFDAARNELLSIPGVQYVSKSTKVPGDKESDTSTYQFKYNGELYRMGSVKVSTDYFKTLNIALMQGRLFNDSYADQHTRTAIINETAARTLRLNNPVGKTITFMDCDSVPIQIAGVVKDFNVQGFETTVQPMVYTIANNACMFQSGGGFLIKLNGPHLQKTIAAIAEAWKKIEPDFPISYSFLDDNFQRLFIAYLRLEKIITFFTIVAVLIAAMGLFALTAFLAGQRTKEIGIRKVLGASMSNLTVLLSKDFIKLVFVAVVITTPAAYWAMDKWLQTFAYRIHLGWWIFALAASIITVIAILTVSTQALKTAMANPVKSLRSE